MSFFDINLTEEEQAEQIRRHFIHRRRFYVIFISVIVLSAVTIWQYTEYKQRQLDEATSLFFQMQRAFVSNNYVQLKDSFFQLDEKHTDNLYTGIAGLYASHTALEKKDEQFAQVALRSIIASDNDPGIIAIARLKLANILLELHKHQEGLSVLEDNTIPKEFKHLVLARKADIKLDLGQKNKALELYKQSVEISKTKDSRFSKFISARIYHLTKGAGALMK